MKASLYMFVSSTLLWKPFSSLFHFIETYLISIYCPGVKIHDCIHLNKNYYCFLVTQE